MTVMSRRDPMKARKVSDDLFGPGFICFAHRGASGHEPENTLLAVERAVEMGAPWIEIDVYAVEGELVVIHDERLDATTNGTGIVTQRSLSYLMSLDAGKGQKIPLLHEVFERVGGRAGVNVELKGSGAAALVVKRIKEYAGLQGMDGAKVLVSSFDHRELTDVRSLNPAIPIGALGFDFPPAHAGFAEDLGAVSVHTSSALINRDFVDDAHRRGLKVFVYTVNSPRDLKRLRAMGVDGVFTDYPELVIANDPEHV